MNELLLKEFVRESNRIEGIHRDPTQEEINELSRFMNYDEITIPRLEQFVSVYQPNTPLRTKAGMNVRVGNYIAPAGGPNLKIALQDLLKNQHVLDSFTLHCRYEMIHPFMDCNGRSGRALWAWKEKDLRLGFLHKFYYQTLTNFR